MKAKRWNFNSSYPKGSKSPRLLINSSGGKLIVEVLDDRQLARIKEDIFDLQHKITSIIYELCIPQLAVQIYIENIDFNE